MGFDTMPYKISDQTQTNVSLLDALSLKGVIRWPIDYETDKQTFTQTADTLDSWMGGPSWRASGHKFIQFGRDASGSLFCLWFYPELIEEPPVVFIGSEGDTYVVSNNSTDFIKQITSGYIFNDGSWLEPDEEELQELNWDALLEIGQKFTGSTCSSPSELTDIAISNHPSLEEWVDDNAE